jgi:hypothetical protein
MRRLIASAIVVLALAACGGGGPPASGSITFDPPSFTCANPVDGRMTVRLPSVVTGDTTVRVMLDGKQMTTSPVSEGFIRQADNSWLDSAQWVTVDDMTKGCNQPGGGLLMSVGTHAIQVLDAKGVVLATGSYTVTQ